MAQNVESWPTKCQEFEFTDKIQFETYLNRFVHLLLQNPSFLDALTEYVKKMFSDTFYGTDCWS